MGIEVAIFGYMVSLSTIITVASIAYQISQARKMKKAAAAAAEARKGFEVVVEGEAVHLPLIYGRAKVGGVRVYHNVANNFNYVTPNSDKAFITDGFNGNLTGQKNEYLFFQQALCQGPINAVYDVSFEESRYLNDEDINNSSLVIYDAGSGDENGWTPNIQTRTDLKSGVRIDLHYGNTPIADNIMTANFGERKDAKFTVKKNEVGLAYASVVIKLNRDQPQFNGVPLTQFFIEGRKVKSIVRTGDSSNYSYSLSTNRTYSNNPALCLLDYLTDDVSGKSLSLNKLDLKSFYDAAVICNTTVQSNTLVGGKIWQSTDGTRNISNRALPLYECNIIIDTEKPIRENVESLLSTMGDARLVWSGGKYKLNLQYPTSNSAIVVATTLTDDDLILEDDIKINWPSSSERLNYCTVRFHNEAENFKEDTVSWPPKTTGVSLKGIGGFKYPIRNNFDSSTAGRKLLNSYGVWSGNTANTTLNYKFVVRESGTHTLEYTADDTIAVTILNTSNNSIVLNTGVQGDLNSVKTASIYLAADTVYSIQLVAVDTGGEKGVAAKLSLNNFIVWTTKSDAYTSFITTVTNSDVYDTMKAEDGGLEFETDLFAEGATDYYHALAKAEELVRTSRTAFGITFRYVVKNNFLEPGDFIRLNSKTLKLGETSPLYLRVNQVKVTEESTCEVTATRFDYTQLAWNVKDDEYLKPSNLYNFTVDQPRNLVFTPESVNILSSVGSLNWDDISSPDLASYIVYMYKPGNVLADGTILWTELGRSIESQFTLPALTLTSVIFGVRAVTKAGKLSEITTTDLITLTPAIAATAYILQLSNDSISLTCDKDGIPVTGQLPKTITATVTKGDVVYTSNVSYAINTVGCTATLTNNIISLTAVSADYAKVIVTATIGTLVLTKETIISKSRSGLAGNKTTGVYLYQWALASTTPGSPNGESTYTWTNSTNSNYTGANGWQTTVPTNPGTPLLKLWVASKNISVLSNEIASTIDWTTGVNVAVFSQNGATGTPGLQSAKVKLYQPSATIPQPPVGTSTYTWVDGSYTYGGLYGWSTSPPSSSTGLAGQTLWVATVFISDSAINTSTQVNWVTAEITAESYYASNSTTPGPSGASARVAYAVTTTTPSSSPSTVTVGGDNLPTTGSWFVGITWSRNAPASLTEGQFLYQVDGLYNPATAVNSTTWTGIPYLSSLKVGNLSAITANTGQLIVTDTIKVGSTASTSNGVLITTSGIEIYNSGILRVKLGSI